MKSNSLKSPFRVSQLSPTRKKCLRLVILRFVSFPCHRCSFWPWWGRNCAPVLTYKRRAMLFPILPSLSFLTTCFCQTGHLSISQWGLYLGYSPKAQYCRCTALISYKVVMAFLIQCCLMLYVEHQSAGANDCQAILWEARHKLQSWSYCHSKRKGCWVSGEKWEGRTWH